MPHEKKFDPRASEADIVACFRLLLGRRPSPEEWRGHSMRVGEDLAGVVASFLTSREFREHRLIEPAGPGRVAIAELAGFRICLDEADGAAGRHVQADNYKRDVTAVFRDLLRPGMGVLDIGADIGYFTLLAAAAVGPDGYVLAIDPDPRNVRLLEASRRLNGFDHVAVAQVAAAGEPGLLTLTTSPLPQAWRELLDAELVTAGRPDDLLPAGRRIDLIKAGVQGAEYTALLGCRRTIAAFRPVIVSEFSPSLLAGISGIEARRYLGWLKDQGYALSIIMPDGSARPADDPEAVMREHAGRRTGQLDLLARPRG